MGRLKLRGTTLFLIVDSHVLRGLPRGWRQFFGAMAATARLVAEVGLERAICPISLRRHLAMSLLTDIWSVRRRISGFVTC